MPSLIIDDYRVTENLWRITELKKLNEAPCKGGQKKNRALQILQGAIFFRF